MTRQRHGAHTQASFLRGVADSSVIGSLIKAPRNLGRQLLWVVKSIDNDTKGRFAFGSSNWGLKSLSKGLALSTGVPSTRCRAALWGCWLPIRVAPFDFSSVCLEIGFFSMVVALTT